MALRWYVVCKTCGEEIELNETCVPPIVKGLHQVETKEKETILCRNPHCGTARDYSGEDFKTHDD